MCSDRTGRSMPLRTAFQAGLAVTRNIVSQPLIHRTIPSGVVTMSAPRVVKALLDPVPYIAPAGVMNAAGATPQAGVAPGRILSIFGVNLAPDGMLPQTLGGLTVRVGDRILPL